MGETVAAMGKAMRRASKALGITKAVKVSKDDAELLEKIRKHVALDADATEAQRKLELDDLRFCDPSTQWADEDRRAREDAGRPCLTEDRLGPFLRQVCNEQRKNKPGVTVNPVDNGGDVDTAEVIQGLIRHIEYNSNADTAYDTAFEWAASVGRGFYRVCTDYVSTDGFEQEILIKRVPNPHLVFVDPAAQESDYSDMQWGGFKSWLSQEDFKRLWPNAQMANMGTGEWKSLGDDAEDWMARDGGACLVVEYFYKEPKKSTIYQLEDGTTVKELPEGVTAKATREAVTDTVKWVKCTAGEILERGEFPSRYIPIVAVLGKETIVDGVRTYSGLIRAGKDPQKRHNYLLTSQVERIAFMPLATWIGAKGFMGNQKALWNRSHKTQMAALEFEIIGDDGQGINAPRLITEEAPIRAVTEAMVGADQGLKAVLGMYDPSLGNREGSQSGLAIGRLQQQAETGNFHYQDNLSRAIRYEGRIILDLLPTIYDTDRVIRIIGEDGTQSTVRINGNPGEGDEGNIREGLPRIFDVKTGKYDVTISTGPSYQSKRQEDRATFMAMLQGPMGQQIATGMPDLVFSVLDTPIARKMADRAKKMLPPQLQDQEDGKPQIPPQVQAQMQQEAQMNQALTQRVNELQDALDKQAIQARATIEKAKVDAEARVEVAKINAQAGLREAEIKAAVPGSVQGAEQFMAQLQQDLGDLQELVLAMHGQMAPKHEGMETPRMEAMEPPHQELGEAPQPLPQPAMTAGADQPMTAGPMAGMEAPNGQ